MARTHFLVRTPASFSWPESTDCIAKQSLFGGKDCRGGDRAVVVMVVAGGGGGGYGYVCVGVVEGNNNHFTKTKNRFTRPDCTRRERDTLGLSWKRQ